MGGTMEQIKTRFSSFQMNSMQNPALLTPKIYDPEITQAACTRLRRLSFCFSLTRPKAIGDLLVFLFYFFTGILP